MKTELERRKEIEDLFARYCEALDDKDWDALIPMFTEDASADWFSGGWTQDNRDDVISFIREWVDTEHIETHHVIGNHLAEIDGDTAKASCRVCAYHMGVNKKEGLHQESLAKFWGELVDTPEGWKFKKFGETLYVFKGTNDAFPRNVPVD